MSSKVTIAIPTLDYVHVNFAFSLAVMIKETELPIDLVKGKGSNICQNRNLLVHAAKQVNSEFILFHDNDLSGPPFAVTRMHQIMEEKHIDVLGCNYLFKNPPHQSMVITKNREEQALTGLDEVDALPTGMMMIRMNVFDKLKQPYFIYDPVEQDGINTAGTEDYHFCDNLRAAGISIFMDTNLSFGLVHWGGNMGVRWIQQPPGYEYHFDVISYQESK